MKVMDVPLFTLCEENTSCHHLLRVYEPIPGKKRSVFYKNKLYQATFPDLYFVRKFCYFKDQNSSWITNVDQYKVFTWDGKSNTFSVPVLPHVFPSTHEPSSTIFPRSIGLANVTQAFGDVCEYVDVVVDHPHPGEKFFSTEFKYYAPDYPRHGDCVNWLTLDILKEAYLKEYRSMNSLKIHSYSTAHCKLWDTEYVKEAAEAKPQEADFSFAKETDNV